MKKRIISLFTILCIAVSTVPSMMLPAAAEPSVYGYGTNVLQNPNPESNDHWELENCSYGKFLNLGKDEPYIFGAKQGTDIAVRQRVTLNDADVIRANNGELTLSASGRFYAQGSRNLTANLNIICYNSAGAVLATYNDRDSGYSISGRTKTLSIGESLIPAGTTSIVYEGTEVLGSGNAYFGMYDFSMIFYDKTTPVVKTEPYLYAVNNDTNLPSYAVPEDKITYAIDFSEPVTVSISPTMDLSIEEGVNCDITYSLDRQTVYFTTALANTGTNTTVQLKKIAGLSVKDDAGNELSYTNEGLSVGNLPYKSVFNVTSDLTNLTLSGNATVQYKNMYDAKLEPKAGYELPDSITITVNGSVINGYGYYPLSGSLSINASAVTGDIHITAAANPRTYTIFLWKYDGSTYPDVKQATYLDSLPSVTPPTRAGYTFGGYYTEADGNGIQYYNYDGTPSRKCDFTNHMDLYAKWTPNEYTVTLDAQGGSGSTTVTATYNQAMPAITKPVRQGYTFSGYYTEQNGGGTKYYNADGTSAMKYDKTDGLMLYAAWTANRHTVTLDMQSGSGGTESVTATYDQAMPVITPPTRTGYTFGGYFENVNGEGVQYYYANGASAKTFDTDSAITLYAKWTPNTYDVVLNAQGGSGGVTVTAIYDSDMPVIVEPDKPGYIFGGYFSETNGGGTKYYNADGSSAATYTLTEGVTLYAFWTPITYNIQLYSRGENVGAITNVTYGTLVLPSAESLGITYPNHNFAGWNTYDEQNWAMYVADKTYSAGLVTEQGKTAYVYAVWLEKDKYTVTYDANGGEAVPPAVEVHEDETITLSSSVPRRENYTFIGWSENSDDDTAQYQPGDDFTMGNSLVTLFALWEKNPELSYNANGGVFSTYAGVSYPAAGSGVTLTSARPQKDGYTFLGWAENETAAADEIISLPYTMPDRDTVLYAVYEPIKYEINVSAATGYSVDGIYADGYTLGEYAEFTVSGANPKVYINGIRVLPDDGKYKFEVRANSSVVISDSSSVNVIYNANGGMDAPVDMNVYSNGDTAYITSNSPVREGYLFSGWTKTPDLGDTIYNSGDSITVSSEDTVLYALWNPITYTVRYDSNGGSGVMATTSAVYDEAFDLSDNTFTKEGCQFAGWAYSPDGELSYINGASVKNLSDTQGEEITLYAVWKSAETTIYFRFEGGTSGTVSCDVEYGQILPTDKLTAPSRYGFMFAGYYTAANKGGSLVYNQDMTLSDYYKSNPWSSVSSEFYLYAAWEPVKYTVVFVSGTETLTETEAVYGQSFALPKAETLGISVPEGYSFKGWSVAPGSDTVYYLDGQNITTGLTGENSATVYLYAVILKDESYTVTLPASGAGYHVYYDGNELTAGENVTVNKNEEISFSVIVDEGYSADKMTVLTNGIMLGAVQTNANTYSYSIKNISSDTSVNIYNVTKEKFSIILNDGTGYSVYPKNITVESGQDFSFSVTLKEGYKTAVPVVYVNGQTLSGTKNEDVFTYTVSAVKAQPVISISVTPNPQYTVTFISNGGIYLISTVEEGMQASQPSTPDRYGYTFGGWYTDTEFNNAYDFQTDITGALTLYAKWIANTYTVEYDKNTTESVSVPGNQTKLHDTVLALSSNIPVRTGYTFTGWNTKTDGTGTSYRAGDELSINSNITLYAQWEINKYAVSLVIGDGVNGSISANEAEYNGTVKITVTSTDGYTPPVITAIPQENAVLISDGNYRITGPVCFVATAEAKTIYTAEFYHSGGLYYTQSAIEGNLDTIILPNPPEKQGHTFIGWFTQPTGGIEVNASTVLDKNMSVYAQFTANTLTVTPAQSGTGYTVSSTDSTSVAYGGSYTFDVTIAEHYNADNMRVYANGVLLTGNASGNVYTYTVENITANQTITITGVELDKHTVTYIVDGQVYTTETVSYGEKITEPLAPVKQGVAFTGWSDGVSIWDFENDTLTSDITLTAQWSDNMYTVTPAQSGSGYTVSSADSTSVAYGGSYTFDVTIAEHYNADNMRAYANGVLLTGNASGNVYTYTVENITANQTITVTGVELDKHTVTYMVDGQVYTTETVSYGKKITEPLAPVKQGVAFTGWSDGVSIWDFANDTLTSDITLTAQWSDNMYTVTPAQSGSGYTVSSTDSTSVAYGGSYTFDVTIAEHYNADNMRVYANGMLLIGSASGNVYTYTVENITANQTITVTGVELDKHTVTYIVDGQVYTTETVSYGEKITEPLAPVKQGVEFTGWSDGDSIWDFANDTLTSDITLTAQWSDNMYTVTPAQSGTGYTVSSTDSTSVAYGGSYTFDVTIAEHYNADNMRVYANGVLLTASVNGNVYTYTIENITANQTITVTGIELDKHTVTYMVDGQVYHESNVIYGSKLTLPANPVKEGMRFIGWAYESNIWDFDNDIVECDVSLIAQWEILTYHVTLPTSNDAYTVTGSGDTVEYGNEYTFTITVASGYNIDNMVIHANGIELIPVSFSDSVICYTISNITENITVSIRGIGIDTYAVTYHSSAEEYVANMPEGQVKEHGSSIILSELEPERYGYTFIGWSTEAGGGVTYSSGAEYTADEDIDLYAVWVPMTYIVTYETNGGTINSGEINEYVYSVGAVLPSDVTKDGFDFIGWYDNEFLEGVRITEITPTDSGDKKYYASYSISGVTPNNYEGEYDGNVHTLEYTLVDKLTVQSYQWYFKAADSSIFVPVQSESAYSYTVGNVSDSGEYYCYIEALQDNYVVRFNTGTATVNITKKPLSIKAGDASKIYDTLPLTSKEFGFADGTALIEGHTAKVTMTDSSTITNAGTAENTVQDVAVYDLNNNDVTYNYEINHIPGTLAVTPVTVTVEGKTVSKYKNDSVKESELYNISGVLNGEELSLDNMSFVITDSNGETVTGLNEFTAKTGTYTIVITFNGFTGNGSENYTASGSITSDITVSSRPSGGGGGGGTVPTKYVISFDTNGAEKIDSVSVVKNQTLKAPQEPTKEGYIFDGWYTDKEFTTEYDFSSKVTKSFTLYAKWTENKTDDNNDDNQPVSDNPFDDVEPDDWYYDDVSYAVENGLFNGTTDTTFDPNGIITRAMLVTVLYRAEGNPEVTNTATFEDVDTKAYYAQAVAWGQQNGIIKGYSETEFAPDENIIREQIAAIMHRYAKYKGIDTTEEELTDILSYSDYNDISEYAVPSVKYVVGSGLMKGKTDATFNPVDNATRAEIAAILHRFIEANDK